MRNGNKILTKPDFKEKETVKQMFNSISHSYDFLNHLFSLGIDKKWRKKVVNILKKDKPKKILDIASGTADFAISIAKCNPEQIIGTDISSKMLAIGKDKVKKKNLNNIIKLQEADAENLPFENDSFDALTVGFGVRNFENLQKGLSEMIRVLKPGAKAYILEFSKPENKIILFLFNIYFCRFVPFVGRIISGNKNAYSYLHKTVNSFPYGEEFMKEMKKAGFSEINFRNMSFGICSVYYGQKRK